METENRTWYYDEKFGIVSTEKIRTLIFADLTSDLLIVEFFFCSLSFFLTMTCSRRWWLRAGEGVGQDGGVGGYEWRGRVAVRM